MEERLLQTTADGSFTVAIPARGITYHSHHGAVQETRHVFIEAGLVPLLQDRSQLRILEMGLGTGLNLLMTAQAAAGTGVHIDYTALELYPLLATEFDSLSYAGALNWAAADDLLAVIHQSEWNKKVMLSAEIAFEKIQCDLVEWQTDQRFGLIYYDAFAPDAQPELWTESVFAKLLSLSEPGALLVTYCSKGDVRRAMQAAGWTVEKLPGPKGKREMLRARRA